MKIYQVTYMIQHKINQVGDSTAEAARAAKERLIKTYGDRVVVQSVIQIDPPLPGEPDAPNEPPFGPRPPLGKPPTGGPTGATFSRVPVLPDAIAEAA